MALLLGGTVQGSGVGAGAIAWGGAIGVTASPPAGAEYPAAGAMGSINVEDSFVRLTAPAGVEGGFAIPGGAANTHTVTLTFALPPGSTGPITSVTLATSGAITAGFQPSDVTFTGTSLTFDITGWTYGAGASLTVYLNFVPPPPPQEPGGPPPAPPNYTNFLLNEFGYILRYYTFGRVPLLPETVTTPTGQVLPNPLIANQSKVVAWANQANAGTLSLRAALDQIVDLADGTTAVAVMTYGFFTGRIPTAAGLDYLVSSPLNDRDLNDGFYAGTSLENRYINFAVNLGKAGEGRANFVSGYGALTLEQATTKAYVEVFGTTPDAAKLAAILTPARVAYLTSMGGDDIGTKAAMVGFLLGEAAKSDVGRYSVMTENFLYDLADGVAGYGALLTDYWNAGPRYHGLLGEVVG